MRCSCGSKDIDFQESSGHAVCCVCGKIIEENTIVSGLEFEDTGDRSHVIGQFVSAEGTKPMRSNFNSRSHHRSSGGASKSREITMSNAKRVIHQVASLLKLPNLFVDKAHRLYGRALQGKFTYGRQQTHVVAVCLYIICRLEKSSHLLIDFSDQLHINIYTLGKSYLALCRLLNLQQQLPLIDPALYIHRFVQKFQLSDENEKSDIILPGNTTKTTLQNSIIMTSLRIITRMKKDWMTTGRRPDGICAVAIWLSLRCHENVNNITTSKIPTLQEISLLFRISVDTIKKRLLEFQNTPAAQLTVQQFNQIMSTTMDNNNTNSNSSSNDEYRHDPPSFIRNNCITIDENNEIEVPIKDIIKTTFDNIEVEILNSQILSEK